MITNDDVVRQLEHTSSNYRKHSSANPLQRRLIEQFHRAAARLAARAAPQRVLDAGCGEGFGLRSVLPAATPTMVGIDQSLPSLKFARRADRRPAFVAGDLMSLPFPDAHFDLVVCMEVLEHLDQPDQGLRELCRVSSRWLLLSVPHEPLFRGANLLRGKNVTRWGNDPGHVNHWSARSFARFVERRCAIVEQAQSFPWTLVLCRKTT